MTRLRTPGERAYPGSGRAFSRSGSAPGALSRPSAKPCAAPPSGSSLSRELAGRPRESRTWRAAHGGMERRLQRQVRGVLAPQSLAGALGLASRPSAGKTPALPRTPWTLSRTRGSVPPSPPPLRRTSVSLPSLAHVSLLPSPCVILGYF